MQMEINAQFALQTMCKSVWKTEQTMDGWMDGWMDVKMPDKLDLL